MRFVKNIFVTKLNFLQQFLIIALILINAFD